MIWSWLIRVWDDFSTAARCIGIVEVQIVAVERRGWLLGVCCHLWWNSLQLTIWEFVHDSFQLALILVEWLTLIFINIKLNNIIWAWYIRVWDDENQFYRNVDCDFNVQVVAIAVILFEDRGWLLRKGCICFHHGVYSLISKLIRLVLYFMTWLFRSLSTSCVSMVVDSLLYVECCTRCIMLQLQHMAAQHDIFHYCWLYGNLRVKYVAVALKVNHNP